MPIGKKLRIAIDYIIMVVHIPKKSLGQHWLHDVEALSAMCEAAEVSAQDTILEIGPGLGTLTQLLTKKAKNVIAIEFDSGLAQALPGRVQAGNLQTVEHDFMTFDLTTLPTDYKLVANIPYYLTSNLIRVISESINSPSTAALLIQKEVAERIVATPGNMSLLSVSAQFYWEVSLGRIVKAELFTPVPKVDSQILILKKRISQLFPGIDIQIFFRIVKGGFSSRRKTLINSLSAGMRINKLVVREILSKSNIDESLRPQNLTLKQWRDIYETVRQMKIL